MLPMTKGTAKTNGPLDRKSKLTRRSRLRNQRRISQSATDQLTAPNWREDDFIIEEGRL
jgi:hypothetical protein